MSIKSKPKEKKKTNPKVTDVMIVEDDQFLSEMLSTKFISKGYKVKPAFNGQEGLDLLEELQPRVILLDIIMPVLNGYQFLTEIKKRPDCKHIPILVLSNLGQPEEIAEAMDLGAMHFLVKADYTPEEIFTKVSTFITDDK